MNGLCYLNYIEFSLILSLFLLLFRKFLINKTIGFILNLINKIYKNKKVKGTILETKANLDKYSQILIVFVFLCLFFVKFINIYYSSNLSGDIDNFINVYNHIKNQNFGFLLFSYNFCVHKKNKPEPHFYSEARPYFKKKKN